MEALPCLALVTEHTSAGAQSPAADCRVHNWLDVLAPWWPIQVGRMLVDGSTAEAGGAARKPKDGA
jgi:hypothetical protein